MSDLDVKDNLEFFQLKLIRRAIRAGESIYPYEERMLLWSTVKEIEHEKNLNAKEPDSKN